VRIKITILLISIALGAFAQTFPVGFMSINFKDPSRSGGTTIANSVQMPGAGRDIGAAVFYPAVSAGTNVAVANGNFPIVVFGHGFLMTYDSYNNIYNSLASNGYIVILPRTEGSAAPNHLEFGKDLAFLAEQFKSFNSASTPSSITIFNGKVSQSCAIGGHSMGGGCSFIGAQNNTSITCVFNMAAATSNTSGVSSLAGASLISVPCLVLSGQRDCVVDTTVQNAHYSNLSSSKKFHVISKGLTHCDFGNGSSFNCTFGQNASGCSNTISNSLAFTSYMNYLLPFLNNQLKSDCSEGVRFMDSISNPSSLRTGRKIVGTIACTSSDLSNYTRQNSVSLFPNPTATNLYLKFKSNIQSFTNLCITDKLGRIVYTLDGKSITNSSNEIILETSELNAGIYFINIYYNSYKETYKFIKEKVSSRYQ
jgi:esterase/lipase